MHFTPVTAFRIRQVIALTVGWVVVGILVELNNAINYDPGSGKHFLYFIFGNSLFSHLAITAIGPLIGGIFAGSFIVFYQRERLKGKSYIQKILIHSAIYILFVFTCIVAVGLIGALNGDNSLSYKQRFYNDVFSLRILRLTITWYFIVLLTIFLLDVSERYGTETFSKLLRGKYHSPIKEERIFMFLDMKASTTIAESLGDDKYFKMLHLFFQIANETVINNFGLIYQYIGDEIIISWDKKEDADQAYSLKCYFAIQAALKKNSEIFLRQSGVVPSFKAGVHCGPVSGGLIGSIKKDIVYSGDVLNATARIVGLCNAYDKDLVVSELVYNLFKGNPGFSFTYLDSPVLRGKSLPMALYAVNKVSEVPV